MSSQSSRKNAKAQAISKSSNTLSQNALRPLAAAIVGMFTLPGEEPVVRYNNSFAKRATAVANTKYVVDAQWNSTAVDGLSGMPADEWFACTFRCAERSLVQYDADTSNKSYVIYGNDEGVGPFAPVAPSTAWSQQFLKNEGIYLKTPYLVANASNTHNPHGSTLMAGTPDGSTGSSARFFWLDTDADVALSINSSGTFSATLIADLYHPEGIFENVVSAGVAIANNTQVASITVPVPGYYALRVVTTGDGVLNFSAGSVTWAGDTFAHQMMSGFDVQGGSVKGLRTMANSLLYTPTASALNNQGKLAQYQAPRGMLWSAFALDYQAVAKPNDASTRPLRNGGFGFMLPSQSKDFDMKCYSTYVNGTLVDSFYPILPDSDFLIFYAECADLEGRDAQLTIEYAVEFETDVTWFDVERPTVPSNQWVQIVDSVKYVPQFHDNPDHWKEIWGAIKSGASKALAGIAKYGPQILKGAETVASLLA